MINRLMALLAFAVLAGFLAIMVWHVRRWDLGIVIGVTLLLAAVDLFLGSRKKRNGR